MFNKFFYPSSVCIPGASTKEKSIGYELLKTIRSYGYTGKIFPVNPGAKEILGYPCFASIEEIGEEIDLAIVVVPKKFVFDTIASLLKKGVKALILITAGFRETGEEGAAKEKELLSMVSAAGARIVGPNCMGIINSFPKVKLNATFVAEHPKESRAAFLSQSGALGAAVLNGLRETDVSFGHFISVGNKADINENDLLNYWLSTDEISAIAMYLESFVAGEEFIRKITTATELKPVVIVKAGRGEAGMKAASSHTGAMGGSDRVVESLLEQFGIIRAETVDEMFNTLKGFERFPVPAGNRIAVVTNAGGPAILCVDALEKKGLKIAALSKTTKNALREFVHPEGSVANPVDLLPGGTAEQYKSAAEILLDDVSVDAVVVIFVEPVMVPAMPVVEGINSIEHTKPVYQIVMPLPEFWQAYRTASPSNKPIFRKPEEPAAVISNILRYTRGLENRESERISPSLKSLVEMNFQNGWLKDTETGMLLKSYDIPLTQTDIVTPDKLTEFAKTAPLPLVLKGIAEGVTHKSDMQLVVLNIANEESLLSEAGLMQERAAKAGAVLNAFLIQPYVKTRFELLVGGYRDSSFGPVIMFGTGGKYVEALNDTAMRSAYLNDIDIDSLIGSVNIYKMLKGIRGEAATDLEPLKNIIRSAAQMMIDFPRIQEFDLNPVIVTDAGEYVCVDARIRWESD